MKIRTTVFFTSILIAFGTFMVSAAAAKLGNPFLPIFAAAIFVIINSLAGAQGSEIINMNTPENERIKNPLFVIFFWSTVAATIGCLTGKLFFF